MIKQVFVFLENSEKYIYLPRVEDMITPLLRFSICIHNKRAEYTEQYAATSIIRKN